MESIPDLLYLKRRTWPRQIPPTEMRLAKGQVQEYTISFSQNPTYASAEEPDYDQRFNVPERRWTAEPKNFVNLFCAVIYDLLWRILYAGEDILARDVAVQRNPTQTSPLAVIMASIVPMNYAYISPRGRCLFRTGKCLPLSITTSKVPSSNVKLRMSITSPEAAIRLDFGVFMTC
jgi:hypothetical protein